MSQSMQQVLDQAPAFSVTDSPAMQARDAGATALRGNLVACLADAPEAAELGLRVEAGGRRGNYSPIAWVRVFSPELAPRATAGRYLVYLFAADGSRVYLSLNQGTSDSLREGLRPINNPTLLESWASEARAELGDLIEDPAAIEAAIKIDLAIEHALVGPYSKSRGRNYEYANILAREYRSGAIPEDDELRADLYGMLPLLARLYGSAAPVTVRWEAAPARPSRREAPAAAESAGQRYLMDSAVRTAIETFAEDRATEYFKGIGWEVERVGRFHYGYDLDCRRGDGDVLHVEVKGTQGRGEEVFLTRNEVRHNTESARCGAAHALYVLSAVRVERRDPPRCAGGIALCLLPWTIDPAALSEVQYAYRVPGDAG